jgi:DNA-directed RNA polymerase subunit N (RpoN/RPB10)
MAQSVANNDWGAGPITCLECGFPIGDVGEEFRRRMRAQVAAVLARDGVTERWRYVAPDLAISSRQILIDLGVPLSTSNCCANNLISTLCFHDQ